MKKLIVFLLILAGCGQKNKSVTIVMKSGLVYHLEALFCTQRDYKDNGHFDFVCYAADFGTQICKFEADPDKIKSVVWEEKCR